MASGDSACRSSERRAAIVSRASPRSWASPGPAWPPVRSVSRLRQAPERAWAPIVALLPLSRWSRRLISTGFVILSGDESGRARQRSTSGRAMSYCRDQPPGASVALEGSRRRCLAPPCFQHLPACRHRSPRRQPCAPSQARQPGRRFPPSPRSGIGRQAPCSASSAQPGSSSAINSLGRGRSRPKDPRL